MYKSYNDIKESDEFLEVKGPKDPTKLKHTKESK
jgi:hypothetical protein